MTRTKTRRKRLPSRRSGLVASSPSHGQGRQGQSNPGAPFLGGNMGKILKFQDPISNANIRVEVLTSGVSITVGDRGVSGTFHLTSASARKFARWLQENVGWGSSASLWQQKAS